MLAYAWLVGEMFNGMLISKGYARIWAILPNGLASGQVVSLQYDGRDWIHDIAVDASGAVYARGERWLAVADGRA